MKDRQYYSPSDDNEKENQSLRANYNHQRSNKKFTYAHYEHPKMARKQSLTQTRDNNAQSQEIRQLRQALAEQKKKVKFLQSKTIEQQLNVLDNLQMLQCKFQGISSEKQKIENELKRMRNQNDWRVRYQNLMLQHKKVKGISDSLIDMMNKVEGCDGDLHQAWRWVKRIVWQYEAIKKKAYEWKQVYDEVTNAVQKMDKQTHNSK